MSTQTKKKIFRFNIKNVKYALPETLGGYGTPKDLAYAKKLELTALYDEMNLYGDGELLAVLGDDKGKTGSLTVINLEDAYEIDMGRSMEIDGGIADIETSKSVRHAIYYEVNARQDGKTVTIKNWLLNCITGKASETYEQTEEDPTINPYEYPLTVLGENLRKADNSDDHVDTDGNTIKVFRITAWPDTTGYATFGDTVPVPKLKA